MPTFIEQNSNSKEDGGKWNEMKQYSRRLNLIVPLLFLGCPELIVSFSFMNIKKNEQNWIIVRYNNSSAIYKSWADISWKVLYVSRPIPFRFFPKKKVSDVGYMSYKRTNNFMPAVRDLK